MEYNVDLVGKKIKDNISSLFFKSPAKPEETDKSKKDLSAPKAKPKHKVKLSFRLKQFTYNINTIPKLGRIPAVLICGAFLVVPFFIFFEPAVSISMNSVHIGFCKSQSELYLAQNLIEQSIKSSWDKDFSLSEEITFTPSFTLKDNIMDTNDLIYSISDASESICMASALTINGEIVGACQSADDVKYVINQLLNEYKTSPSDTASFVQSVKVSTLPVSTDIVMSSLSLLQSIKNDNLLDVQVVTTENYTKSIPYQTQRIETDELDQNTTKTIQFGANGVASVSEQVIILNGHETQRRVLNTSVITPATDCIISVGTRSNGIGSGQFISPISGYTFTSAFKFRNGKLHKGVDLAVPVGTPVYAADSGVVEVSKLSDSFGNYIVINHQNGLKTLYAHNSALLVKEGDKISKGQQIALSGNTGNSTGPHLHFEVHNNDIAVNPSIYINFGTEQ